MHTGQVNVVGYARVSTAEQGESGLGLEAQRHLIEADIARRGWNLVEVVADEGVSGSVKPEARPGFGRVIDMLRGGDVAGVVVAKLDRMSRSLAHQTELVDLANRRNWTIVALDVDLDTSTATGRLVANLMGSVNQHFRDVIAERTREALAAKRARGDRLGRPVVLAGTTRTRIAAARADGLSFQAIADELNLDEVPTAHGGLRWHASTVRKVVLSVERDRLTAAVRES